MDIDLFRLESAAVGVINVVGYLFLFSFLHHLYI